MRVNIYNGRMINKKVVIIGIIGSAIMFALFFIPFIQGGYYLPGQNEHGESITVYVDKWYSLFNILNNESRIYLGIMLFFGLASNLVALVLGAISIIKDNNQLMRISFTSFIVAIALFIICLLFAISNMPLG